jgi:RND superfamily putative drug exporter
VAAVTPAITAPDGTAELASVYPVSGPQSSQTVRLIDTLRGGLIPHAEQDTSLAAHVGGVTATNIDFAQVLTAKLPLFIAVVVVLAFLLLTVVFRSLLIPLLASVMNLLSVAAAFGRPTPSSTGAGAPRPSGCPGPARSTPSSR